MIASIVLVYFARNTTPEEREEVLTLVDGEVVGGIPVTPYGFYIVRVPDDGTGQGACDAVEVLKASPLIRSASLDVEVDHNYRKPTDGEEWRKWWAIPDSADGKNWAL